MKYVFIRRVIAYCIAVVLIILGGSSFINGISISTNTVNIEKQQTQYPLGDLRGIVVDNKGRIYCGIHFYNRVQVYDNNGMFLYSLSINGLGGDFMLNLDENGELNVATTRNHMLYVFDDNGNLLKQEENGSKYDEFASKNEYSYIAKDNNKYVINNPLIMFPSIAKVKSNGEKVILVSNTLISWLNMGPLPAWLFIGIGLFTLFGGAIGFRKYYKIIVNAFSDIKR